MKIVLCIEGDYSSSSGSWLFKIRSRDWLRLARPSLFGTPVQEISNHLAVFVLILFYMVGSPFVMVGIDFASLVHPNWDSLAKIRKH